MSFKIFLEKKEEEKDIENLLNKLPKKHKDLLKNFNFKYTPGNTLDNDKDHIGVILKNKITVAAPWNYSRKFTTLHEIAHLIWEEIVTKEQKKEWSEIVKKTKGKQNQNNEELFCMAYGCYYSNKHCPRIHDHETWNEFIKKIQ